MTSLLLKRRCCCEATDEVTSCGCGTSSDDDCAIIDDLIDPVFPPTLTVNYNRFSIAAQSVSGYCFTDNSNIHSMDEEVCTDPTSEELVGCDYCSDCVDSDLRYIAKGAMQELTKGLQCIMTLQDGVAPCNGRYADTDEVCVGYYRGTVQEGGSIGTTTFPCDCESEYSWAGHLACWAAKLTIKKVGGRASVDLVVDCGLQAPGSTVDCDCNDNPTNFSGSLTGGALLYRTASGAGEDLDGKCGYCYFPWQAFGALELISGGASYPTNLPAQSGTETVTRALGDDGVTLVGAPTYLDHLGCNLMCCIPQSIPYGLWDSFDDAVEIELDGSWNITYWDDSDVSDWHTANPGLVLPLIRSRCASSGTTLPTGPIVTESCSAADHWTEPGDENDDGYDDWVPDCPTWSTPEQDWIDGECTMYQNETTTCTGPTSGNANKVHQGNQSLVEGAFLRLDIMVSGTG